MKGLFNFEYSHTCSFFFLQEFSDRQQFESCSEILIVFSDLRHTGSDKEQWQVKVFATWGETT